MQDLRVGYRREGLKVVLDLAGRGGGDMLRLAAALSRASRAGLAAVTVA